MSKDADSDVADILKPGRWFSNMLALWAMCSQSKCRKAGACRATSLACLRECNDCVPLNVSDLAFLLLDGKEQRLSFDEALAHVPEDVKEDWQNWHRAIKRITGRPSYNMAAARAQPA